MGSPPLAAADAGADEDRREHREDVGLDQADKDLERHQRDRHEQPGQRQYRGDRELPARDVPNNRTIREKVRVISDRTLSGNMMTVGLA